VRQTNSLPPGYYADPANPSQQRWWDGEAWAVSAIAPPVYVPPEVELPKRPPRTNQFAMASLVLSISWVFFIGSVLGVIFGHLALPQIKESNGEETGRGSAMLGLLIGYTGIAAGLLVVLLLAS
jgi:hypothetical protein